MLKKFLIGTFVVLALGVAMVASAAYDFGPTTLKVGSSGVYVSTLQSFVGATADGSFGPMTKAKVMAWQASNGLVADGVFGPMSKAKANATGPVVNDDLCPNGKTVASSCTVLPAGATGPLCPNGQTVASNCGANGGTPTGLVGTSGEISDINQIASYNNEEIGDGENDVKVMGFDVVASNDGDIALKSIKLTLDDSPYTVTGGASTRLSDYVDSVSVWMGSEKVGTADSADFTKESTGVYSKTITLSNAVIKADETEKFYVSVDAISNLDSGDITYESWSVGINNIRYIDGEGVVTTYSATDINTTAANLDWSTAGNGVGMSFVSYSTSADTELKISLDSNSPDSQAVEVSTTANTDGVVLLKGKMKLTGTSNVWLDSMPILFTTGATNVSDVASTVYLTIDGQEFSESTTTGTTNTVAFDNLDLTLVAGSTVSFTISADVNNIEAGVFDEGDTLSAVITETQTDAATYIVENTEGDALIDDEKTGAASGETQAFYSKGISVKLVGTPTSVVSTAGDPAATTPTSDTGTFKITFEVTAFGDDMRIDDDVIVDTSTYTTVDQLSYSQAGTYAFASTSGTLASTTGATHDTESFLVEEGTPETFTVTVVGLASDTASQDCFKSVKIEGIGWTTGSADAVGANIYTFDLADFMTPDLYMNAN